MMSNLIKTLTICFLLSTLVAMCKKSEQDILSFRGQSSVIILKNSNRLDTTDVKGRLTQSFPPNTQYASIRQKASDIHLTFGIQHPTYCNLKVDSLVERFFILPNDTLIIQLPLENQNYLGRAEQINNYLRDKERTLGIEDFIFAKGSLTTTSPDLESLEASITSITQQELEFLNHSKSKHQLPKWYVLFEKNDISYFGAIVKLSAPSYRRTLLNKEEQIPKNYYNFIDSIPINNVSAVTSVYYWEYISQLAMHYILADSLGDTISNMHPNDLYAKKLSFFDENLIQSIRDYSYAYLLSREITEAHKADSIFVSESIDLISNDSVKYFLNTLWLENRKSKLKKGDKAPNFHLKTEDDSLLALSTFNGKTLLVSFWATWCKPCIKQFPNENKLYAEFAGKDFELVSVCLGSSPASWKRLIAIHDLKGFNLYANESWQLSIKRDYNISSLPHYTLIDTNGLIIGNKVLDPSDKHLKRMIRSLLD